MSVDLDEIADIVGSIMNATRDAYGYGSATKIDKLHPRAQAQKCALAAARSVIAAIYNTPNHPFRDKLISTVAITNGQTYAGPIGAILVDGKKATKLAPSKLKIMQHSEVAFLTTNNTGYYCIEGHTVSFIGTAAVIETTTDPTGSNLDVPDEYYGVVLAGGLHFAFPGGGTNVEASANFGQTFNHMLDLIGQGKTSMPAFIPPGNAIL